MPMASFNFSASNFFAATRETSDTSDHAFTEVRISSKRFGLDISMSCKVPRSSN